MNPPTPSFSPVVRPRRARVVKNRVFLALCVGVTLLTVAMLAVLLFTILRDGWKHLDWSFINSYPSRKPEKSGIKSALWGSVWLCLVAAAAAIPLGVATAIALEEFRPRRRLSRFLHTGIQINIGNLAGVPSVVYGVIGLTVFARMFGLFGGSNPAIYDQMAVLTLKSGQVIQAVVESETDSELKLISPTQGSLTLAPGEVARRREVYVREHILTLKDGSTVRGSFRNLTGAGVTLITPAGEERSLAPSEVAAYRSRKFIRCGNPDSFLYFQLPFGPSILAGGVTLGLVILPIVIIASREAIRAVPPSLREGAFALGATRWQAIRRIVLPSSIPGIMTGGILAMSRAIGEAAPLLMAGAFLFILNTPRNLFDSFAALPLQIFNWTGKPQEEFHKVAASGIIILLAVLLTFNAAAIFIRQRFSRPLQ